MSLRAPAKRAILVVFRPAISYKDGLKGRVTMKVQIGQSIKVTRVQKFVSWAGTCTSALCAVHCFGTAVVAVLSPGLLKILPHSEVVEIVVLAISIVTACLSLSRVGAQTYQWLLMAFFAGIGLAGLNLHIHGLLAVSLISLAVLQLLVIWKTHHPKRSSDIPDCCQHEHKHGN